jgi:geranylgeranyl pyrophosphate synthase
MQLLCSNGENSLTTAPFFIPVQDRIRLVEDRMLAASNGHHPDLRAALEHLLSSGGKRVRPTVALLTGGMLEADPDKLITLAAAIELLHTATLVHDDLIDGSLLRRGIPTINARWSPAATVLTGDYIFARAAKLASETDSVEVMKLFADTLSTIVNGEITQLFSYHSRSYREEYFSRIYAKTASMFELATSAAAALSPSYQQTIDSVRSYGYEVGMAFQIIDDVLDFTGSSDTVGKPVASDLKQGLITLPTIYFMEEYPENAEIELIRSGILFDESRLSRLTTAIQESKAIEKSISEAKLFIDRALISLSELPQTVERQALEDLANYIIQRNS